MLWNNSLGFSICFCACRTAGNMQSRLTNNRLNPPWPASTLEPAPSTSQCRRTQDLSSHCLRERGSRLLPSQDQRLVGKNILSLFSLSLPHTHTQHTHMHLINPHCAKFTSLESSTRGKPLARPSHRALSLTNQYHFPVLELGNYEVERLPDLSPALHYFADIKINCLILGKHMLQFKLSALVCSGIICIDLPASSQFCLLTSWIIREGASGKLKSELRRNMETSTVNCALC